MKKTVLSLFAMAMIASVNAGAQTYNYKKTTTHKRAYQETYSSAYGSKWSGSHSPWDFTGQLGLYSPGFGIQGLAAYRVSDGFLDTTDDSLSVEAGLGYISVSDTVGGGVTYSLIEIPIMARWDFHLSNQKFIVGPRGGFNFIAGGGSVTVNGISYSVRGNALYFQVGGDAMYRFTDQWAARLQLMFINYTSLSFGVTYFL